MADRFTKMKRIITIIIALFMTISLFACSTEKNQRETEKHESSGVITSDITGEKSQTDTDIKSSYEIISLVSSELTVASIKKDGTLWMYGSNDYGQVGNGTTERVASFIKVLSDVTIVKLGRYCSAAIKKDGSLWAWGQNRYGQLGDPSIGNDKFEDKFQIQTVPVKIMEDVACVAVGEGNIAAVKKDGSLWISGQNGYGQIGIGTISQFETFTKVMDDVSFVDFGDGNVVAVKKDGSLWTWGINAAGTIGNGENGSIDNYKTSPVKILENISTVKCAGFWGFQNTVALSNDNSLLVWGADQYGQVGCSQNGNGTDAWGRTAQTIPVSVLNDIVEMSITRVGNLDYTVSFALDKNGELFSWGLNDNGQIGNGTTENASTPYKVMSNVRQAIVQGSVAGSLQCDGSLWVWGYYDGKKDIVTTPTKISEGIDFFYIARQRDIYAIKNDGLLYKYMPSKNEFQRAFE